MLKSPTEGKQKGGSASRREIDTAEQILLQVDQVTKRLGHDAELLGITPKISDTLLKKLDARLTPDSVKAYSVGWDGANTRGMDVLGQLKQARESYGNVCDFINSMCACRDSPLASCASLEAALRRVRNGGIAVASKADEGVVLRMVNEALQNKEFDKIKVALDGNSETMKRMGLEASALQLNIIQKNIIDMCREGNEQNMVGMQAQLTSYISLLPTIGIFDENLTIEVSRLHALMTLASDVFKKEEFPQLQSERDEFFLRKSGVFYKAFTLLPLGSRISASAAKVVDRMLQDKSCELALTALTSSMSSLPAPLPSQLIHDGKFVIPNRQQWAEAAALYAQVATMASDRLRAEHEVSLQEAAGNFEMLESVISEAVLNKVKETLKDFHEKLRKAVSIKLTGDVAATEPNKKVKALQGSLEKVMAILRAAKELDYQETLPKEAAASLTSALDAKLMTMEKVGALLPWLMQYVCNGTADVAAESALTSLKSTRA